MRFRWFHVLPAMVLALPFATGCSGCNKRDANTIVIMSSLPRTGSAKGQTDTMVNGIKMTIDEYGGKVGDFTILYQDKDDAEASSGQWTAAAETANANAAVNDKDVMVFIGPYNSGAAAVSMPILN